ncbi:MAG: methyltransferase domain-containing protein [Candidatus Binatus sp.]|uniref:class I SAM-dependent methyltransferase n=1 Tax=Candidatus Binatus sp. TaxID=2811406 RepID=UPI002727DDC2|nr:methyltransferase domain-containing protein [Candidatus Binatus sp.]MDO8435047.1 methyltransferase domain-containing protein [Candidatus Binatus sp.]
MPADDQTNVPFRLETARAAELNGVKRMFKAGAFVIDVGAGDGYQASLLKSWGCVVLPLEVAVRPEAGYSNLVIYDGTAIPVRSGAADAIFSSNVLEHVTPADLDLLLPEIRRVLNPETGIFVCLLPSSAWRFWTSIAHYAFAVRYLAGRRDVLGGRSPDLRDSMRKSGKLYAFSRALFPAAHGAAPTSVHELFRFRAQVWRRTFRRHGFEVVGQGDNGLFYTGFSLFPSMGIETRRLLARWFGASCHVFILRPQEKAHDRKSCQ